MSVTCFVASAFGRSDVDKVFDECIYPSLRKLYIKPLRVDRVEHNDDIDDKIVELIEICDFVLVDLTYARPSVYYEAGYAAGLGKPVIYIARSDHLLPRDSDPDGLLRVHFDLQMKNIISWTTDFDEFRNRLEKRIRHLMGPFLSKGRRNPKDNSRTLFELAMTQGGYFTAAQALAVGYSYRQQHYHRTSSTWIRVEHGVYRLRDYPPGDREDLIRLALWSHNRQGDIQAVVSHETALSIHRLSDLMPATIHLTVPPRGFRKPAPPGVVIHRAALHPEDIEVHAGYLVTGPLRTLLDVAASSLSQEHIDRAVHDGLEIGLLQRSQLTHLTPEDQTQARILRAFDYWQHSSDQA